MSERIELRSESETEQFGRDFAKGLKKGDFVAMYGDLGAGKTAFVRGMASYLVPNERVSSPTYAIVNEYIGAENTLCHFDMYRITDEDDLYSVGFWDYRDCIFAVEWAENIPYALPESYYKVTITKGDGDTRFIEIEEKGAK